MLAVRRRHQDVRADVAPGGDALGRGQLGPVGPVGSPGSRALGRVDGVEGEFALADPAADRGGTAVHRIDGEDPAGLYHRVVDGQFFADFPDRIQRFIQRRAGPGVERDGPGLFDQTAVRGFRDRLPQAGGQRHRREDADEKASHVVQIYIRARKVIVYFGE